MLVLVVLGFESFDMSKFRPLWKCYHGKIDAVATANVESPGVVQI